MRTLASLVPVPRRLVLGDRDYLVSEFRLRELAALQVWVEEREPNPLDAIRAAIEEVPTAERRRLLRAASDRAEAWPAPLGTPEAARLLATAEGVCVLLGLGLQRDQPSLSGGDLVAIGLALKPGQFAAFRRVAFGVDTGREIEQMLVPDDDPDRRPADWHRAIDEVARERHLAYEQVYAMTISEFANARLRGRAPEGGMVRLRPGEDMAAVAARLKARWDSDED